MTMQAARYDCSIEAMDTFADRVERVVREHRVASFEAWSETAGWSPSNVRVIQTRARKSGKTPGDEIVRRLAESAGVSFAWLRDDVGSIDDPYRAPSVPPPIRGAHPHASHASRAPLLRALRVAFQGDRSLDPDDLDATERVLAEGSASLEEMPESDLVGVMYRWLCAARRLRLAGKSVTLHAIALHLASRSHDAAERATAAANAEADHDLAGLGGERPEQPVRLPKTT